MENTKRQKAMRVVLFGIALIILASIALYLLPTEYSASFTGISYRFDELRKIEDVEIELNGDFKRSFFKEMYLKVHC